MRRVTQLFVVGLVTAAVFAGSKERTAPTSRRSA
jgi:hypothetical protein